MPPNQLFADWVAGQTMTAAKMNQIKNDLAALAGANFTGTLQVNGQTVWHAGNDGTGSGLDADRLDGYHASSLFGSAIKPVSANYTLDIGADQGSYITVTAHASVTLPGDADSGWSCRVRHAAGDMNSVWLVAGAGASTNSFSGWLDVIPGRTVFLVSNGSGLWYVDGFLRPRTVAVPATGLTLTSFVPTLP